jgi:hypothetical protein
VLDFSFDIDVKLGALNYFVLAIFLLAPDARRLLNLLVLNRATSPAVLRPLWPERPWTARAMAVCKALFIFALVVPGVQFAWQNRPVARPKGPLYGIYDVEKFVEHGRDRPGVATESGRWSKVAFVDLEGSTAGEVTIRNSDDSIVRYRSVSAGPKPRLTWSDIPFWSGSNAARFVFSYSRPDSNLLVLQNDQLEITMRRVDTPYPLFTRKFHWIIETPFNR